MRGQLYIDGRDAYSQFGVFITKGGYDELLAYAPLKKVHSVDWQEEDGEEFDLWSPVLDSRELSIPFAMQGAECDPGAFIASLSDQAYHSFEFRAIGRTHRLRLVSQAGLKLGRRLGMFALRFADDFPLEGYAYEAPASALCDQADYQIDGVRLSRYGVCVLEASSEQIVKMPAVKKNLLRNIESQAGVIYDDAVVRFQTKEVKITCLMRARTLSGFWRNYDALLFDLTRPGERQFAAHRVEYACYYKNCSTMEFAQAGGVWFKFSLGLVFIVMNGKSIR